MATMARYDFDRCTVRTRHVRIGDRAACAAHVDRKARPDPKERRVHRERKVTRAPRERRERRAPGDPAVARPAIRAHRA